MWMIGRSWTTFCFHVRVHKNGDSESTTESHHTYDKICVRFVESGLRCLFNRVYNEEFVLLGTTVITFAYLQNQTWIQIVPRRAPQVCVRGL